jgi:hypothetical protein
VDTRVQEVRRLVAKEPIFANQQLLDRTLIQAGYKQVYTSCKRSKERNHPYVRSHRQTVLCPECGGQGWTDTVWVVGV